MSPEIKMSDITKRINAILSHSYFSEKIMGIDLPLNYIIFTNTNKFNDKGISILPLEVGIILNKKIISQFIQIDKVICKCKISSEL